MNKPTLVIMAAGMGSRFGGLKQIEPIDDYGHIIIVFSLFNAWQAGFRDLRLSSRPKWKPRSVKSLATAWKNISIFHMCTKPLISFQKAMLYRKVTQNLGVPVMQPCVAKVS